MVYMDINYFLLKKDNCKSHKQSTENESTTRNVVVAPVLDIVYTGSDYIFLRGTDGQIFSKRKGKRSIVLFMTWESKYKNKIILQVKGNTNKVLPCIYILMRCSRKVPDIYREEDIGVIVPFLKEPMHSALLNFLCDL